MTINYPIVAPDQDIESADFNTFRKDVIRNAGDYGVTGGSANAQTLTIDSSIGLADIVDGFKVRFEAGFTTTSTTPTLNVNSTGAVVLLDKDGNTFPVNGLIAGGYYEAVKQGLNWVVSNNVVLTDRVIQFTAETDLIARTVVSRVKNDPTKVEQTCLRFFSDGALDTETTTSTAVICELNRRQFIELDIVSGSIRARVGTINRNKTISMGTQTGAIVTAIEVFQAIRVDTNRVLVSYEESANVHKLVVIGVDTDGTTVLNGTAVTVTNSIAAIFSQQYLSLFSTNTALLVYDKTSSLVSARAMTISNLTINLGAQFDTTQVNGRTGQIMCIGLTSTVGVIAFIETSTNDTRVQIVSLSGTTLASVATSLISGSANSVTAIVRYTATDCFVIVDNSTTGTARVSTTTITADNQTATLGTVNRNIRIGAVNNIDIFISPASTTTLLPLTADSSDWTTAPSIGSFTFSGTRQIAVLAEFGTDDGLRFVTASATTLTLYEHYGNLKGIVGVVNATYTKGDTVNVYIKDFATGLSGLTAGVRYYLDVDGTLSTTRNLYQIGVALNATTLTVDVKKVDRSYSDNDTISTRSGVNQASIFNIRDDWDRIITKSFSIERGGTDDDTQVHVGEITRFGADFAWASTDVCTFDSISISPRITYNSSSDFIIMAESNSTSVENAYGVTAI